MKWRISYRSSLCNSKYTLALRPRAHISRWQMGFAFFLCFWCKITTVFISCTHCNMIAYGFIENFMLKGKNIQ